MCIQRHGVAQRCTHAQMNASTHPSLAWGLKQPPHAFSYSDVTFCPDTSLKSVTGSGGVISTASKWAEGDRSSRGCRMMSWCWIMRVNLTPRGWGGGSENFLLWPDGSSLVYPLSLWAWPRARSRLLPGMPGGNTASLLQVLSIHLSRLNQFWPSFCFLVLLYFSTSLVRDGETGAPSVASGSDNQESAPVLFLVLLLHQSYSPLHLSIRVWDCRSLSRRTREVFHADYRGASLCNRLSCSVVLCPRELAEPPSQIWLDLECVIPMKHLWYHFLLKSRYQSEQITIFCFSLWVPGVCDPLGTFKLCT